MNVLCLAVTQLLPGFFTGKNPVINKLNTKTMKASQFRLFTSILLIAVLAACTGKQPKVSKNEHMVLATLYQQTSAEYAALCYQAFNQAEIMVRDALNKDLGGELAIITDIDETVLDNSPYQAKCILEGINYPEKWDEWCQLAQARGIPGSQSFFNFVADQGIQIFYITNRKVHLMQPTLDNLRRQGFPFAEESHLLMRENLNSKESRRRLVEGKYRVILLIGDNLDDFTNAFEEKTVDERKEMASKFKSTFGRRFIVFPNAMYGSWESMLYSPSDTRHHFLTSFPLSGSK